MPKFSFIVATYNRTVNIALILKALSLQTDPDFEVIIADDGSEDNTRDVVLSFRDRLRLKYYWHKHDGYGVCLVRNQGARLRQAGCTHLWYIDSDVMLNRKAVAHARELCGQHPDKVICGRYDWLPPMKVTEADVEHRWDDIMNHRLPRVAVDYETPLIGEDPREARVWTCPNEWPFGVMGIALSGNLIVPAMWFVRTGGFDESLKTAGEDCEFSYNLADKGARAICCPHIIGYHVDHRRDKAWMDASVLETIKYQWAKWGRTEV